MSKSPCSERAENIPGPPPPHIEYDDSPERWSSVLHVRLAAPYFDPALSALGKAIREIADSIARATEANDIDLDYVEGSGCELVEELLGMAFVVCQRHVDAVESVAIKVLRLKKADKSIYKDHRLRRLGPQLPSGLSKVQVIDSAANYFKHGGAWLGSWKKLAKNKSRDARVLLRLKIPEDSMGQQFRDISEALGNTEYADTHVFGGILTEWGEDVRGLAGRL
jgi:hypothetical protein